MSFRFWRRIKIAPGVTLNLSKTGGSASFGPRGAKFTVGPHGRRATAGIPGTGLFYTRKLSAGKARRGGKSAAAAAAAPVVPAENRLTLGFFKRLFTPADEQALVDGCRELSLGDEDKAYAHLRKAVHLADGAYLAGFLALKRERLDAAADFLNIAAAKRAGLGRNFAKYGISAVMSLPITDEISVHVGPDLSGVWLGLVEVHQRRRHWREALAFLDRLRKREPGDAVVKLSLAELLLAADPDDKGACRRIVKLTEGVRNETPVHAALLLYKARALRRLGLADAARDVLTTALRRTKGRSADLLNALRYERASAYTDLGRTRRARSDLEKLYAADPDYEDVAAKLGL